MQFDLSAHFGTMTRAVETGERDGKPVKAVIAARRYDTDPEDLWNALTSAERIRRWFLPISGDLKLGGKYQFEGNAGGTITTCEPPRRLEATWEFGGGMSWIALVLSPEAGGTRLVLTHTAPIDPHWDNYGPAAVGVGWDLGLLGLAQHLLDPSVDLPIEERNDWAISDQAKSAYRTSAEAWGEAAIESGDPVDVARAAAERTRQFYSGETPPSA
jgi:uncharacterized protein YndB with AHSA1/START domain